MRAVIVAACVVLAGVLAVVVLLGLVNRDPGAGEVIQTFVTGAWRPARCRP